MILSRHAKPALAVLVFLLLTGLAVSLKAPPQNSSASFELRAPAGTLPAKINPAGETILPNGRLITPLGRHVVVAPHPYGLALSMDGKILMTANGGTEPLSVSVITQLDAARPRVVQIPPGFKPSDADPESVYLGVAISPDDQTLYVSEGNNGLVGIFDRRSGRQVRAVNLNGRFQGNLYRHSLTGDIRLSTDGNILYVLDLAHFRLVIADARSARVLSSIRVGRLPFGLALSPDGKRLYVSNVGMFRYSVIPGYNPKHPGRTGLAFPAFGFGSTEAEAGVTVDGRKIPGLGDPNTLQSNSLWMINVSNPAHPSVLAQVATGLPVGEDSVGGSSPGAVIAGHDKVFVSNANQDSITILDARTLTIEKTVVLQPAASVNGLRGVLPFGLALSPDEKRLYVACAGINALAVLDTQRGEVSGYIPTAWFPARVKVSHDGKTLYVANAKGFGSGPNGGPAFHMGPEGTYIGDIMKGVVSIFPVPEDSVLKRMTERVLRNNGFLPLQPPVSRSLQFPIPPPGRPSAEIHHVVFIVKENRTFDQIFGDLHEVAGERVEADRELAEFGDDALIQKKGGGQIEGVRVTPNHHALAERFNLSDNFYVDSDVSADGHHWLVGNYPNELIETSWPPAYAGKLDFVPAQDAPGRLEIGWEPWPETYVQAGTIWDHFARYHITFRNYGEGLNLPGAETEERFKPTGVREVVNIPLPGPLYKHTSRSYPGFNTSIPDQYRFAQFQHEFQTRYLSGREPLPQFLYIWLPGDHTADPRPKDGYPYRASYVADNDLALGKLIELFSHSPYWKHMAIFVTEDDAQDGRDHVDAHRSLLLVISPYARRGVSHVHTSIASILKTFDLIFGLPYLNQYDAAATGLSDCFTNQPDFAPYNALPPDKRVFDPAKVAESGLGMEAGHLPPSAPLDDPALIRRDLYERLKRTNEN